MTSNDDLTILEVCKVFLEDLMLNFEFTLCKERSVFHLLFWIILTHIMIKVMTLSLIND
jgi:hypothetical protein